MHLNFSLQKKHKTEKKIVSGILASIFFIIAFLTASTWLVIDKKVKSLPDWWEIARWEIQVFDTDILASQQYSKPESALLGRDQLKGLIGPIDLKFDVKVLSDNEARNWFKIDKYIWEIWDEDTTIIETLEPEVFYTFDTQQTYELTLTLEWIDAVGKAQSKIVDTLPSVEIGSLIDINEEILDSGGKLLRFDASSLQQQGTLEWYFEDDFTTPVSKGYIFRPGKPIFDETIIALYIKNASKTDNSFDRVFVIKWESDNEISGTIITQADDENPLLYNLSVADASNAFWNGYIDSFLWKIDGKEFTRKWDIEQSQRSSLLAYEFENFGEHEIAVVLQDSAWKTKTLNTTVTIDKQLLLETPIEIFNDGWLLDTVSYDAKNGEYFVDNLPIPTTLSLSAKNVTTQDPLYSLQSVRWDLNSDGDVDEIEEYIDYEIPREKDYEITLDYTFIHRKNKTTVDIQETIYIQAVKKDVIIKLDIKLWSPYVPTIVSFDASQSSVLWQDIVKFEYDYGDGIIEEIDAINQWHSYKKAGDYDVKLTAITNTGERHSITKKLILKNKPDIVKIQPSLYSAPIGQEIDFSSAQSSGQITGYFWDFWDGNISSEANPSHSYNLPWDKTVKLTLEFKNNNTQTDEITISILP